MYEEFEKEFALEGDEEEIEKTDETEDEEEASDEEEDFTEGER